MVDLQHAEGYVRSAWAGSVTEPRILTVLQYLTSMTDNTDSKFLIPIIIGEVRGFCLMQRIQKGPEDVPITHNVLASK